MKLSSRYAPLAAFQSIAVDGGAQIEHNGEGNIQFSKRSPSGQMDVIHVSAAELYAFLLVSGFATVTPELITALDAHVQRHADDCPCTCEPLEAAR